MPIYTAVVYNHFPQTARAMHTSIRKIVRLTAEDLMAVAANNAPVDTGFLRNSIYVTGAGGKSTYGGGVQKAGSLKANKQGIISRKRIQGHVNRVARQRKQEAMLFNEIAPPPEDTSASVAVAATYGIYLEMGTRKMAAQPYFYPAVETMKPIFQARLDGIEADMRGSIL